MEIIMPKMGDAMTEGKVVRWYKKQGDVVKKGEPVLEIETDKVNLDLEAEQDGTLGVLSVNEGEMAPVGGVLALLLAEGETDAPAAEKEAAPKKDAVAEDARAAKKDSGKDAPAADEETAPADAANVSAPGKQERRGTDKKDSVKHSTGEYGEAIDMKGPRRDRTSAPPSGPRAVAAPEGDGGRRRSSPLARKMARELGVSIDELQGSGPGGRIVASDVKGAQSRPDSSGSTSASAAVSSSASKSPSDAKQSKPAAAPMKPAAALEAKQIPLSAMRRTIAKRLAESTGPIPHFYLTVDYDVTDLLALRQQLIDISGKKVSLNDFVVRGAALALRHHPNVNASWGDEAISQHGEVHIGIAVATPEGLITPVVRNADTKSVVDIAAEVRALAEKAKNRKLMPNEYQGPTFTISNLGAWGIEEFTAIINPPNSAILAIGAAIAQPVVVDRQIVVRERMKVTMSCDHRVIDGAGGADYLKTLRQYIEQPLRLIV